MESRRGGSQRPQRQFVPRSGRFVEVGPKLSKRDMPLVPRFCRREEVVLHVAEELDLHYVNFLNGYSRHVGPRLVGVGVVVEELVAQHQRYRKQSILAAWLSFDRGIDGLQTVDEEQGQENYVLCHLRGREDCCDPFAEARRRLGVFDERSYWKWRGASVKGLMQNGRVFEPKKASNLCGKLGHARLGCSDCGGYL